MSAFAFIPVEPEEALVQSSGTAVMPLPTASKANFYTKTIANDKRVRARNLFQRSLEYIKGIFVKDTDQYTVEEMDLMIDHFRQAIMFLQQEKTEKKLETRN